MDIVKHINDKMQEAVTSGELPKMIEAELQSALKKSISSAIGDFFSYGDGKKRIQELIKNSLFLGSETIILPDYREMILSQITELVKEDMDITGAQKIKECVAKIKGDYPKEISIEEVIEDFCKTEFEYDDDYEIKFSLHIDAKDNLAFIRFDKEPNKQHFMCAHNLVLHKDGSIYSYEYENRKSNNTRIHFGKELNFSSQLFGYYSAATKITGAWDVCPEDLNIYRKGE
jgi:hypothetical protein